MRISFLFISLAALALSGARGWPNATVLAAAGGGTGAMAAAQPPVDTDGDGMPDDWETFFGLNPNVNDAAGDPDGDGLTNLQEYQQGGHPFGFQKRYLAEGALGFFRTDIGLVNNSATETANVQLTYLTESGSQLTQRVKLLPMTRQTVHANDFLTGVGGGISTIIESNIVIAADRFMEWGATGYGSSLSASATAPSQTWYFAEGATGIFNLYYLLLNPSPTATAHVSIKYLQEIGPPVTRTYTVAPHTRFTISVNTDLALLFTSAGAVVSSDVPIVAERAMYLSSLFEVFSAGAAGAGSPNLATDWSFAEGTPGGFFEEFLLIANPNTQSTIATVTYRRPDGVSASASYLVPGESRATIWVNHEMATNLALSAVANSPISALVTATRPIVAERTMWWPRNSLTWYENATSLGATTPGVAWTVAEGSVGGARHEQTFVLVANTSNAPGQVQFTVLSDAGTTATQTLPIPAFGRLTVEVGPTFSLTNTHVSVFVDSVGPAPVPLVVEYSRYGSGDSRTWSAGGSTLATPRASAPVDTAPTVVSTTPANNATNVAFNSDLSVTFSEQVNVTAAAFTLECPAGTPITLNNLTTSPATTFNLHPAAAMPFSTACKFVVHASGVTDTDTTDPPDQMASDVTVNFTTGACPAITVNPSALSDGTPGVAYGPVQFTQTGGNGAITWTVASGTLPAGFNLSASGQLSGTTTATGTFTFTVRATDANGCFGERTVTLNINCPNIVVSPSTVPDGTPGLAYGPVQFMQTGGNGAITWSHTGTLPAGMNLSAAGLLSGVPTATGTFTITVRATDASGCFGEVTVTFHIVCPPITVNPSTLTDGTTGDPYGPVTFTQTGSTGTATFSVTTGTPPPGLNLSAAGVLSGTPTTAGLSNFTVTATDNYGCSGSRAVSLQINCPVITVSPSTLTNGTAGVAYTPVQFTQTGGHGAITFTVTTGALPAGMNLSGAGLLSGTPQATGVFTFTVTATDANGCTGSVTVSLTVACPVVTVTNPSTASFPAGVALSQNFTQTGATSPVFTLNSGTLPNGLFLSPAGVLSGTPTVTGSFPITVRVDGDFGCSGVGASYPLIIRPNAIDDTYTENVLGNVGVSSSAISFNVLANDILGSAAISAFDATSANGGTVSLTMAGGGAGTFTYDPPRGFTGADTFTYTISDGVSNSTATVHMNIANMTWFINNTAGACPSGPCDGRLSHPYTTLAAFQADNALGTGTHPKAGHTIFVYESATAYTGGVLLQANQHLFGQDATAANFSTLTGLTIPASAVPLPAMNPSGTTVQFSVSTLGVALPSGAQTSIVRGLAIDTATSTVSGIVGTAFGTLQASELSVTGLGRAFNLSNGALAVVAKTVSSTGGAQRGISLTNTTGTFEVTGDGASDPANTTRGRTTAKQGGGTITLGSGGTISGTTNEGVLLSNATNVTLRNMVVQNNTGDGVNANNSSNLTLDNVLITGHATARGLHAPKLAGMTLQHVDINNNATAAGSDALNVANVNFGMRRNASPGAGECAPGSCPDGLTGTATVANSIFQNAHDNVWLMWQANSGTVNLTVTNSTFANATSNSTFHVQAWDSANATVSITGSTLSGSKIAAFNYAGSDSSGGGTLTVSNNTFTTNGVDLNIFHEGLSKTLDYNVSNNITRQSFLINSSTSLGATLGANSNAATQLRGKFIGNTVGNQAVTNSGSDVSFGMAIDSRGAGTHTVLLQNNSVSQVKQDDGLLVLARQGSSTTNLTITGNTFRSSATSGLGLFGVEIDSGSDGTSATTICANLNSNTLFEGDMFASSIFVGTLAPGAVLNLQGYAGANNNATQIASFLSGVATTMNPVPNAGFSVNVGPGTIKAAPSSCPTPP